MTITLTLQPQEEARLIAAAEAKGVSTGVLVREALVRMLGDLPPLEAGQTADARPIWEVMLENIKDVSPAEFSKAPEDGASEHDHYLYGHAKKEQ